MYISRVVLRFTRLFESTSWLTQVSSREWSEGAKTMNRDLTVIDLLLLSTNTPGHFYVHTSDRHIDRPPMCAHSRVYISGPIPFPFGIKPIHSPLFPCCSSAYLYRFGSWVKSRIQLILFAGSYGGDKPNTPVLPRLNSRFLCWSGSYWVLELWSRCIALVDPPGPGVIQRSIGPTSQYLKLEYFKGKFMSWSGVRLITLHTAESAQLSYANYNSSPSHR